MGGNLNALQMIAEARGVRPGAGCSCAFCGDSPYDEHGGLEWCAEQVLAARRHPMHSAICAGCRSLLEGKPGSDPPPLRTLNVWCIDGEISYPSRAELRRAIMDPPDRFIVSWAASRKKHHVLHAGISTPDEQRWGSDGGTIVTSPQHRLALVSIEALIAYHTRDEVISGRYSAAKIASQGARVWREHESAIASYRGRRCMDLMCAVALKPERTQRGSGPLFDGGDMIDQIDHEASLLLARIARGSDYRREHGIDFWGYYFRSRIERHNHRPLADRVSRLLDECQCSSTSADTQDAVAYVASISDEATAQIESSLRTRAGLLVALAYDSIKQEKGASKCAR